MIIELDFLLLLLYFIFFLEEVVRQFMKKVFITFNTSNTSLNILKSYLKNCRYILFINEKNNSKYGLIKQIMLFYLDVMVYA